MKKLYIILAILITFTAVWYFRIPNVIKLENSVVVKANFNNIYRQFLTKENWNNWLFEYKRDNKYIINDLEVSFQKAPNENILVVQIKENDKKLQAYYRLTQLSFDSIVVNTEASVTSATKGVNSKINNYFFAQKVEKTLNSFIEIFKKFAEDKKLFYGLTPRLIKLPDSCMIAKKSFSANYPTTKEIYKEIEVLENYALANNAIAIKPPMLNIKQLKPVGYEFMVSLPVNKRLLGDGEILFKQMLPYGNFLESDSITGTPKRIDSLFMSFENYKNDYHFTSPAIPFHSLVTDRRLGNDSTKWITIFYYPVF